MIVQSAFLLSPLFAAPLQSVKGVVDGDTIVLQNGQMVRLLGVDTPELGRKGKASEPYAKAASRYLSSLIKQSAYRVRLEFDQVKKDHYGRFLAHVFTEANENLSETMLERGLGTLLIIPPNIKYLDHYAKAQKSARKAGRALWGSNFSKPVPAGSLVMPLDKGVQLVRGKVTSVRSTRNNRWIRLNNKLLLKTSRQEAELFPETFPYNLRSKTIEVLGKLYEYDGELRMRLRVPQQLMD